MNRGPFIFIGVLIIVSLSWAVTLVKPIQEAGNLSPIQTGDTRIPTRLAGLAEQGREVYQELGCVNCHTQQTLALVGTDVERGWGARQSMPIDYIEQNVVFTGTNRVGPDLANVGSRRSEADWHYLHFFDPQITSKGSNMPPFAFLFEKRKVVGEPSNHALKLPEGHAAIEAGYEIVPTHKADALVAYMLGLSQAYDIEEAPAPEKLAFK